MSDSTQTAARPKAGPIENAPVLTPPTTLRQAMEIGERVELATTAKGHGMLAVRSLSDVIEFGRVMAQSKSMVGRSFQNDPAACAAITLQALRWGLDPFACSQKAYIVSSNKGEPVMAYEAQLVNAVLNGSPLIKGRLRASYSGEGDQRTITITGRIRGEDEPFVYTSPPLRQVQRNNGSPLWSQDPDRQLYYWATRAWARMYAPDVLMGVYTPDEVEEFQGPPTRRVSVEGESERRSNVRSLRADVVDHYDPNVDPPAPEEPARDIHEDLAEEEEEGVEHVDPDTGEILGEEDPPASAEPQERAAPDLPEGVGRASDLLGPVLPKIPDGPGKGISTARGYVEAVAEHLRALPRAKRSDFLLTHTAGLDEAYRIVPTLTAEIDEALAEEAE